MTISLQETKKIDVRNPWTGKILYTVEQTPPQKVREEIEKLRESPKISADERMSLLEEFGLYLDDNFDHYGRMVAEESGVPKTHVDIRMKIISEKYKMAEDYARIALEPIFGNNYMDVLDEKWVQDPHFKGENYLIRRIPKGTYFLLAPNNDSLGITLISALDLILGGNKVLVKPGTKMPKSTMEAIDTMKEIGLENYISYVNGSGQEMMDTILNSNIDAIFFVGTYKNGKKVHQEAIKNSIPFIGEYEGNNYWLSPGNLSDVKRAVSDFTASTALYNGIACYSIKGGSIENNYEEFREELLKQGEKINKHIGDPVSQNTLLGPILSEKLVGNCVRRINDAVQKGGEVILGGEPMENPNTGKFNIMPYTVLENLDDDTEILFKETPGPVVWIEKDFKRALNWAKRNETKYPVPSAPGKNGIRYVLYTEDIETAKEIGSNYKTGLIGLSGMGINSLQRWGGYGNSSTYPESFAFLINECSYLQVLNKDESLSDLSENWHKMMQR